MTYRTGKPIEPLVHIASGTAVGLNRETGQPMWRYDASTRIMRIVYASERIFLLDSDCILHCLRAPDGALLGKVTCDDRSRWGAAMLLGPNGELYVATSHSVIALDPIGREMWRFEHADLPSSHGSGLAGLALPEGVVQPDIRD